MRNAHKYFKGISSVDRAGRASEVMKEVNASHCSKEQKKVFLYRHFVGGCWRRVWCCFPSLSKLQVPLIA
jgi:hypothetical protein